MSWFCWSLTANILLLLLLLVQLQRRLHRFRRPKMPGQRVSRVVGRVVGPDAGLAQVHGQGGPGEALFVDGPLELKTRHDTVQVVARMAVFDAGHGARRPAPRRGQILTVDGTWTHLPRQEALYREPGCWRAMDAIRVVPGALAQNRITAALVLAALLLAGHLGLLGWRLHLAAMRAASPPPVTLDCPAGTTQVRVDVPAEVATGHACQRPDGSRHGPWVKVLEDGAPLQKGQYADGETHGTWTRWDYLGRRISVSSFHLGHPHGEHSEWYPGGRPRLRAHYRWGKLHGAWTGWSVLGGTTCEGSFREGKRHGEWTRALVGSPMPEDTRGPPCGPGSDAIPGHQRDWRGFSAPPTGRLRWGPLRRSRHTYRRGQLHGPFVLEFASGERADGHYSAGRFDLCWQITYPDGKAKLRRCWQQGLPVSRWQAWYPSGDRLAEFAFDRHGRLHGAWTIWHQRGGRAGAGQYREGRKHGRWTTWDPRGDALVSARWSRGQLRSPASAFVAFKRLCTDGGLDRRPDVELGQVRVQGPLSEYYAGRVLRRHVGHLRHCYLKQLAHDPSVDGTMLVRIDVARSGRVTRSDTDLSTVKHAPLRRCLGQAPRGWLFPAARGPSQISVSITLRRALLLENPLPCPRI